VLSKLVRAVIQIKVAVMSYYPQYWAVITHRKPLRFWFCIIPGGNLPPVWEPLL